MREAKLKQAAQALGDMPLTAKHEIGEVVPFSLRSYLEEILVDEATSDIDIDAVLERMAETVIKTYQSQD